MIEYTPTNWENRTSEQAGTPLSAANMNKIEQGICNLTDGLNRTISDVYLLHESISVLPNNTIIYLKENIKNYKTLHFVLYNNELSIHSVPVAIFCRNVGDDSSPSYKSFALRAFNLSDSSLGVQFGEIRVCYNTANSILVKFSQNQALRNTDKGVSLYSQDTHTYIAAIYASY